MKKFYAGVVLLVVLSLSFGASPLFAGRKKEEAPKETKKKEAVEKKAPIEEEVWTEKESPMLHEMVKAGKLPPLEKRLPKIPFKICDPSSGGIGIKLKIINTPLKVTIIAKNIVK